MRSRLTAEVLPLARVLGGPQLLRVPSYQRPYSWSAEAGQILDDVLLSLAADAERPGTEEGYFFGTMLLMTGGDADAGGRHDIVDGQQRLITLTILLAVLRDICADRGLEVARDIAPMLHAAADGDGHRSPRLVVGGDDQSVLADLVLTPGASFLMPEVELSRSQQLILDAREHFLAELLDKSDGELAALVRYLCEACVVSVITTSGLDRAHRLFEVLNNRGRPLARKDILKAQILGHVPAPERGTYTTRWQALEARLGAHLDDLFAHLRDIEGRGRERIVSGIGEQIRAAGGAKPFFDDSLAPYADILAAIRTAAGPTPAATRTLGYLGWLGSADWVPPAMLRWRQVDGDPARIEPFLARLERLAFCLRLLGIGADKRQTRFNQVLGAVRAGRIDEPGGPLELSREECRNILYNMRNLHARSQLTCKLLLLRVNDELAAAPQCLDPALYTVEHVLPQRPARNSQWRQWFASADAREAATQSLGNLVLVTREQNDKARNLELARKLDIYFAPGADPVPHITADLAGRTSWAPADVAEREERILVAVNRLWELGRGGGQQPEPPLPPARARRAERRAASP